MTFLLSWCQRVRILPLILCSVAGSALSLVAVLVAIPPGSPIRPAPFWTSLVVLSVSLHILQRYQPRQQQQTPETTPSTSTIIDPTTSDVNPSQQDQKEDIDNNTNIETEIPSQPIPTTLGSFETAELRAKRSLTPAQISLTQHLLDKLTNDSTFQPDHCSMALTFVNCKRFLKARNFNLDKGEALWRAAVQWRTSFHMSERRARLTRLSQTPYKDARHDFVQKYWMSWTPSYLHDKYGMPYHVFRAGPADPAGIVRELGGNVDVFVENFIHVLETALERAYEIGEEDRGIIEINDLRDHPDSPHYFHRAYSSVPGFATNTKILDNYYPERLRRVFIIGPPRVFGVVWNIVLPFVPPETKRKLFWFNPNQQEQWVEKITEDIPMDQLHEYLGGKARNDEVRLGILVPPHSFAKEFEPQFAQRQQPLLRLGVIADVQHCDSDDGMNFGKTKLRKYRGALKGLERAVDHWLDVDVHGVLQLGDVIDGMAKNIGDTAQALDRVCAQFDRLPKNIPWAHLVGNHELYNASREELSKRLGQPVGCASSLLPRNAQGHTPIRCIVLDSYEIATIGYSDNSHPHYQTAAKLLDQRNPNSWRTAADWLKGLTGLDRRFVPYNGGMSKSQLDWLDRELTQAVDEGQLVLILSHIPLGVGSASSSCLLWNFDEVMAIVSKYASSRLFGKAGVVAVFCGHDHKGGFAIDDDGIYHVTFASPLEAVDCLAHAVVDLYPGMLVIHGTGGVPCRTLPIFTSQEDARRARELHVKKTVDEFYYTCRKTGFHHRTKQDCEAEFWRRGGAWDALAHVEEGWPRKFHE